MIVGLASELALGAADDVLLSLGQIATSLAHLRVLGVAEGAVGVLLFQRIQPIATWNNQTFQISSIVARNDVRIQKI